MRIPSRRRAFWIPALLVLTLACGREHATPPVPGSVPPAKGADPLAEAVQAASGALLLLPSRYDRGVLGEGSVSDALAVREAENLLATAATAIRGVADAARGRDPQAFRDTETALGALEGLVARRSAPGEVARASDTAAKAVTRIVHPADLPGVAGLARSIERADRAVQAEQIAKGLRIGMYVSPPGEYWVPTPAGRLERQPPMGGENVWIGVLLRDGPTKRALPGAAVFLDVIDPAGFSLARGRLEEVWGSFEQYGSNFSFTTKEGSYVATLRIDPPACARGMGYEDAWTDSFEVKFQIQVLGDQTSVLGAPPGPPDPERIPGDELLRARAIAGTTVTAGDWEVGFFATPPEPFWLWQDGAPVPRPLGTDVTDHLGIVLLDRQTGRAVPNGRVTLALEHTGESRALPLFPILGAIPHYGETLKVPPGSYTVRVRIDPPVIGFAGPPRFQAPAEASFAWTKT